MNTRMKVNKTRFAAFGVTTIVAVMVTASPALADGTPFSTAATQITTITNSAISAAKKVLLVAAVLSLIVGLAPMLWGQVKVKWIVTCLVACSLFSSVGTVVAAFAVGGS